MLDMPAWRERLGALAPRRLLARLPTDCPGCARRTRGGALCAACRPEPWHADGALLCTLCAGRLLGGACPDCLYHAPGFDGVVAAFEYAGRGRDLVLMYKVARRFQLSGVLADLLLAAMQAGGPPLPRSTILVPVPARAAAVRQRGFNPAAELARALAARTGLRCRPGMLLRAAEGRKQASLGRSQRQAALAGVYRAVDVPAGSRIAIVDDVLTTGSTLDVIARELKAAGAASVLGLVAARTPLSHPTGQHVPHHSR